MPTVPAYTPLNLQMFNAAFVGSQTGQGVSGRYLSDPQPADYLDLDLRAWAWAIEFDEQWALTAYANTGDALAIEGAFLASNNAWEHRAAPTDPTVSSDVFILPANYAMEIAAIIALIVSGELTYTAGGITPPPFGGGSGSLPTIAANEVLIGTGAPGYVGSPSLLYTPGRLFTSPDVPLVINSGASTAPGDASADLHIASGLPNNGGSAKSGDVDISTGSTGSSQVAGNLRLRAGAGVTTNGSVEIRQFETTGAVWLRANMNTLVNEIGQPLIGDASQDDPLRFGVTSGIPVTSGGTITLTPSEYANQTILFDGTAPAGALSIVVPATGGWTKFLDFSHSDISAIASLTITNGTSPYVVGIDAGQIELLIVIAGVAGYLQVFKAPKA